MIQILKGFDPVFLLTAKTNLQKHIFIYPTESINEKEG